MRRAIAVLGFFALLALGAASFTVLPTAATRAADVENATFLIPATDGYGVADCLASATECGKVIANAWCEAHGFARAASFGIAAAEEMTGSLQPTAPSVRPAERPLSITCSE
jgi:hypothetical protein